MSQRSRGAAKRPTAGAAAVVFSTAVLAIWSSSCRSSRPVDYVPGLGEIMTLQQMRHIKLWFAGDARNWPLADYELDELEEGFEDSARLHPTHEGAPRRLVDLIPDFTARPLRELRAAIRHEDGPAFVTAYDALTASCNGCHEAVGFSFNVVSRPRSNPYSDQEFRPTR